MQNPALDQDHGNIGDAADQGQHHDRNKNHRRIGLPFPKREQIAKPEIAADQFADDDANHRQCRTDSQAGEHRRHRARKLDAPEDLRARRLERAGEIDQIGIDIAHCGQHIDHHRKEHDEDRHQDFRIDGEAHPENEQRRKRDLWRDLQGEDIGRERQLGGRRHTKQVTDQCAK